VGEGSVKTDARSVSVNCVMRNAAKMCVAAIEKRDSPETDGISRLFILGDRSPVQILNTAFHIRLLMRQRTCLSVLSYSEQNPEKNWRTLRSEAPKEAEERSETVLGR
jgi:hypothetical protein